MATADSVKSKIQELIDTANEATGNADGDLTTAVNSLIAGFGQGGSGDTAKAIIERTITEIDDDSIETIGMYAFYGCALKTARLVNCITHKGYGFYKCSSLTTLELPNLTGSLTNSLAQQCTALTFVDCGFCSNIGYNTFYGCTALAAVVLRRASVVTLPNGSGSFINITGPVTFYVPEALIETYKTATNWSALYEAGTVTFAALEGSEYE